MANRNNNSYGPSLNTPFQFTPVNWNPVQYTPRQVDNTMMLKLVDYLNTTKAATVDQVSKMDEAFAKVRERLSQDKETTLWFDNYVKGYKDKVHQYAQIGDYGTAMLEARKLASEALNSAELDARIKTYDQYQTWKKTLLGNQNINEITKERLLNDPRNAYNFYAQKDNMGNFIGSKEWQPRVNAVNRVNPLDLAVAAKSIVSPERYTSGYGYPKTVVGSDGTEVPGTSYTSESYVRVTPQRLQETFDAVFQLYPGAEASLMQDYKDDKYLLDKLERQLNNNKISEEERTAIKSQIKSVKERLYDGGVIRDPRSYMARSMNIVIDNMAYDWKTEIDKQKTDKTQSTLGITAEDEPGGYTGDDYVNARAATVYENWGEHAQAASQNVAYALRQLEPAFTTVNDTLMWDFNGETGEYTRKKK